MLSISSVFDSGAIEVISLADHRDIQLRIRPDNASEFAQWFHFRLQGAAGLPITLRFVNAGDSAYPQGWRDYDVVASYDRQHWFRVPSHYDGQVLSCQLIPKAQSLYFAYFEPYSEERHLDLIGFASASQHVQLDPLGQSLDGRDLSLLRISDAQGRTPQAEKKKVWLIARQHPGETMAEWFIEGFIQRLLDGDDPLSRVLMDRCQFFVMPNMNPDGAARGNLRTNAAGVNLNREWSAPSLERSPEVFLVRQCMLASGIDLFLDVHGDETLPYNFVAGCEGIPSYTPRLASLEARFKAAWLVASPDFQDSQGYGSSEPGQANLNLATNWVGETFNCLAHTLEMPFKDNADLPDPSCGWNGKRSKKLGASLLQPIFAVLDHLR